MSQFIVFERCEEIKLFGKGEDTTVIFFTDLSSRSKKSLKDP